MQSHDRRSLDVSSFNEEGTDDAYPYKYYNPKTGDMEEKFIYYGCVHREDVMGKAVLRWWPFNKIGTLK